MKAGKGVHASFYFTDQVTMLMFSDREQTGNSMETGKEFISWQRTIRMYYILRRVLIIR